MVAQPSKSVAPQVGPEDTAEPVEVARDAFLASLNHEIRTPLSSIMGLVDLLLETPLDEEQREYASAARLCAESLFELLNATLEFSALQAGQFSVEESEFSLREMLDAVLAQFQVKAEAKSLKLLLTVDANLPETMLGDAARIRELIGHLVSNALKFTRAGSVELRAWVKTGENGDLLSIDVRDTGIGIPEEKLEIIFDSFQQGDEGLARNFSGLGLGLALARKLATIMGGTIEVTSQPEVGSTFTVSLPLRRPPQAVFEQKPEANSNAGAAAARILAVDDNPVGLAVLKHILSRKDYGLDCVASGPQALEVAAHNRYDLVLLDLEMPEMDGLTTARLIRQIPGYSETPIFALTATVSDHIREQCRKNQMQEFVAKPVDATELHAAISRHLANRK